MMLTLCLLLLLAVTHGNGKETDIEHVRVIGSPTKGEEIPLDVSLDRQSMLTYPGTPNPPQSCFKKTINLHDFEKKLVAMKSVENDVCLIKHSNKTYEEIKALVNDIKQGAKSPVVKVTENLMLKKQEIQPEDVEKTTGKKLANFCSDYKVYWLQEGNALPKRRRKRSLACLAFCW